MKSIVFYNLYQAGLISFVLLLNCFSLFAQDGQKDLEYNLRLLEDTISNGQTQVKSLKDELCKNKKDKDKVIQLNKKLEESKKRLVQLKNGLKAISDKQQLLIDENNKTETNLAALREVLSRIKEEAVHKDKLLAEYKDKIAVLKNKSKSISLLKDRLSKSEQRNKALLIEIERLKKDKLMLDNELRLLKKEEVSNNKTFNQEKEKLNGNIDSLNQKISRLKEGIEGRDKELARIEEKNIAFKDKQKDFVYLKKELAQAKKMVADLKRRNNKISVLRDKLKDDIRLKETLLVKIDKLTNELIISRKRANSLMEERNDIREELSNLNNKVKPVRDKDERINRLEEKIKYLSNKQRESLDKKEKEDKELTALKNELLRFKNEFDAIEESHKTKISSSLLDDKNKVIAFLKEKIDALSGKQDDLRKERNKLLQESDFLKNKISQLEEELNGSSRHPERGHKKVLSEINNRRLEQLKEQLDAERAMYSHQVAKLNIEIAGLKEKLQYAKIKNSQIVKEKNELIYHHQKHLNNLLSAEKTSSSYNKEAVQSLKVKLERKNMAISGIDKKASPKKSKAVRQVVKVYLKNGIVLAGKLLEDTKDYIKVERIGIVLSYFKDDIKKIEIIKDNK